MLIIEKTKKYPNQNVPISDEIGFLRD